MIPLTVQTLIVSNSNMPSVLVMRPDEPLNSSGNTRVIPIWIGLPEATQIGIALAIKQDAMVYIDEPILNRASYPYLINDKEQAQPLNESQIKEFHDYVETLRPDDLEED